MVAEKPDLAPVASAIGHPARVEILVALMGGEPRSASQLAGRASLQPSAASHHLSVLLGAGLLTLEGRGRQRHYRLAGPAIAGAIEALAAVAPSRPTRSLRAVSSGEAMAFARSCYDHLAGSLGVALAEVLVGRSWVDALEPGGESELTEAGVRGLERLGIDVDALRGLRRSFARGCLDWTERRPHLAGAVGAALLDRFLELDWLRRRPRDRALVVTPEGAGALRRHFGIG